MEIFCSLQSTQLSKSLHSHSFLPPFKKCYRKFPQHRKMLVQCSISEAKGIRWGCEIDSTENAYRLQNWLNKEGLPPQKLAIQKVDVGGRGLVALKNIRKGEKLLYVPQSLIITPDSVFNLETLKWAFGILFSRLVRLPAMNNQIALIPWADMLNHSSEVDTYLDFDLSSKGIVFAADRAYQPREQVFISYGKKSNSELLLACGFVPEEGTNADDSVAISLAIDKSESCYDQKLEVLHKHGLSTPQSFPLKMTGWPTQLEAYAFLIVSPPSMAQQFEKLAIAASSTGAYGSGLSFPDELRVKAFQLILDTCETGISKYTAFLENMQENGSQNLSEIGQKQFKRQSLLKKLSVDLCSSEQRILFRAQYVLRTKLKDLQGVGLKALNVFNGVKRLFS